MAETSDETHCQSGGMLAEKPNVQDLSAISVNPATSPASTLLPAQPVVRSRLSDFQSWMGPSTAREWLSELLAGFVVCCAQIPESVAFANLANCPPAIGLQAAWIVGIVCALFGGRPGMINGSAGALAAVTTNFVSKQTGSDGVTTYTGLVELFWSVILASVIMLIGAAFNVGKFLCLIPATVVIGFCNGLGWVIGHAQTAWFQDVNGQYLQGDDLLLCSILCAVTFVVMQSLVTFRIRGVPAGLVAIITAIILEFGIFRAVLAKQTPTIRDKSPFDTKQTVPQLFFLNGDYDLTQWGTPSRILNQGVTIALVAMLESLLCLEVMNDLTRTTGEPNRQLAALGVSNLLAGLFGTMGGNSLIELCVMNVQSGGKLRLSSTVCSLGVLIIFVFAYELLNYIPVASLAGIMITVVIGFVRWTSIPAVLAAFLPGACLRPQQGEQSRGRVRDYLWSVRIGKFDAFVIIVVTVLTAVSNLAIAVGVGVSLSAINFAYQQSRPVEIQKRVEEGVKIYKFVGPLFFGARHVVIEAFTPQEDPETVEIDFEESEIFDFAILHELYPVLERYSELGKTVRIVNLASANHLPALLRFGATEEGNNVNNLSVFSASAISNSR